MTDEQRIEKAIRSLHRARKRALIDFKKYIEDHCKVPRTNSNGDVIRHKSNQSPVLRNVKGLDDFKKHFVILSRSSYKSLKDRAAAYDNSQNQWQQTDQQNESQHVVGNK